MTTNTTPDNVALMQLAKSQVNAVDAMVEHPSLLEDTGFHKELRAASHSVLDAIAQGLNEQIPVEFQKNFLVVAKTYNAELRSQALDCFGKKHLQDSEADALVELNKRLENALALHIERLQHNDPKYQNDDTDKSIKKLKHKA